MGIYSFKNFSIDSLVLRHFCISAQCDCRCVSGVVLNGIGEINRYKTTITTENREPHALIWDVLLWWLCATNVILWVFVCSPLFRETYWTKRQHKNVKLYVFCVNYGMRNAFLLTIKSTDFELGWHMVPYMAPCQVCYVGGLLLMPYVNMVLSWASCQIRKIAGAHAPGMPGTFSPPPQVSDPDMHHGTCVTHVPWCMSGSLTSGFLWSRRVGKTFRTFPAHAQPAILHIW